MTRKGIDSLADFFETVQNRAPRDYDTLIVLTGPERTGKSTLAWKIGKRLDPKFGPDRMVFSGQDLVDKALSLPEGSVIVMDEAIVGGFSRDAMTKENKDFVRFLVICGERNLVLMICFPNINYVDKYVKERMHYWILTPKRGQGILHKPMPTDYPGAKPFLKPRFGFEYTGCQDDPGWQEYLRLKHEMVGDRSTKKKESAKDVIEPRLLDAASVLGS